MLQVKTLFVITLVCVSVLLLGLLSCRNGTSHPLDSSAGQSVDSPLKQTVSSLADDSSDISSVPNEPVFKTTLSETSHAGERVPLIDKSIDAQWVQRILGSVPQLANGKVVGYDEELFDRLTASDNNGEIGVSLYPGELMAFDHTPMFIASFSNKKELQWIAHLSPQGKCLSAGTFRCGMPDDGFFLIDFFKLELFTDRNIAPYFLADVASRHRVVELIDGKIVGVIKLNSESCSLVEQYLVSKPTIGSAIVAAISKERDTD